MFLKFFFLYLRIVKFNLIFSFKLKALKKFSALIIEDDIENIAILKLYLKQHCTFINVVAEATTITEGIKSYALTKPDILLLDIQMGNEDIFSFIDSIGDVNSEVIFISSHTEYGVKATNYNVTGFLVKPINVDELKLMLNKAILNIENKVAIENNVCFTSKIAIPSMDSIELISKNSIVYLEADGKYTIFYLEGEQRKIASRNIGEYEKLLDSKLFFRIHHKYLVNTNKIVNIYKTDGGYCQFFDGKTLPIAKRRQELLSKFLKLK